MPASVKDVAALAGVSSSTVSNYLNHPHVLGDVQRRERCEAAIERARLRAERVGPTAARGLQQGARADPARRLAAVLPRALPRRRGRHARGRLVALLQQQQPRRRAGAPQHRHVRGAPGAGHRDLPARRRRAPARTARRSRHPLGRRRPHPRVVDGRIGAASTTAAAGASPASTCCRSAVAASCSSGAPTVSQSNDRLAGLQDAVAGTDADDRRDRRAASRDRGRPARSAERSSRCPPQNALTRSSPRTTWWRSACSRSCCATASACPRTIALVGFDDVDQAHQSVVPLTSVRQPGYEIGRAAGAALIRQLTDPTAELPAPTPFAAELVVRESTVGR